MATIGHHRFISAAFDIQCGGFLKIAASSLQLHKEYRILLLHVYTDKNQKRKSIFTLLYSLQHKFEFK